MRSIVPSFDPKKIVISGEGEKMTVVKRNIDRTNSSHESLCSSA